MIKLAVLILLIITNSAFAQWTLQNSGTSGQLISVSAPSDQVVWASGSNSSSGWKSDVLRTINGGLTWEIVATLDTYPGAGALISGIDGNTAVVCFDTTAYRTTNGGLNWSVVLTQRGGFFNAIEIQPDGNGIIQGDPVDNKWSIWKTTNYGINWNKITTLNGFENDYSSFNSLFVKGDRIYFCGIGGKIFFSSNGGANWTQQSVSLSWPIAIWFYNDTMGLVGSGLAKTINGGANWVTQSAPGSGTIRGISGYGTNWWYIRRYYTIHYSSNQGSSWNTDSTTAGQEFWDIAISQTGTSMWVVGNGGVIYTNNGITGIQPSSTSIPKVFSLLQNYPNPFNPSTKIKFDLPEDAFIELVVYNSAGKFVRRLLNEKLSKGTYETVFDGEGLSSGIYYYTLKTERFTETKKMVFLK